MTSRLIIKNLPAIISKERLKEIFSRKGVVTDVNLQYSQTGKFRRFAFIGYADTKAAFDAKLYFDNTFIDTSKIIVHFALPSHDPSLPRAWSKYTKKNDDAIKEAQAFVPRKSLPATKAGNEMPNIISSILNKPKVWQNDDDTMIPSSGPSITKELVGSKKCGGSNMLLPRTHINFESTMPCKEGIAVLNKNVDSGRTPSEETLRSEVQPALTETQHVTSLLETGRLFVRNLPFTTTEGDLRELFEGYGPISEIHIPLSKDLKVGYGIAFVTYLLPEHAINASSVLDGTVFQGRIIHIMPASANQSSEDMTAASFKAKKMQNLKKNASQSDHHWNSLFIRPDTVVETLAGNMSVSKAMFLDPDSNDLATRLAISETNLIQDTKAFLQENGVQLSAFSSGTTTTRSNTVILAKNFPYTVELAELQSAFAVFGELGRLILAPSKSIAIVEFLHANEAKVAFKKLAYSKFQNVPIFLEWAPEGVLVEAQPKNRGDGANKGDHQKQDPENIDASIDSHHHTLYVKNLNFKTTETSLRQYFENICPVKSVKVALRKDPKKGFLSSGFAFVEFHNHENLNLALDKLHNTVFEGHELQISRSQGVAKSHEHTAKRKDGSGMPDWLDSNCTKLLIRNIPFEANAREVRDLFKAFAQVKGIRLPKKFDRRHRGFGFVEFVSHQEALNAYTLLSSTHLYGRHLVMEWVKPGTFLSTDENKVAP